MHEHLVSRFASAGLTLVLSDKPIIGSLGRGADDIVQIDIRRNVKGNFRKEHFRIFPGHEDNLIEVMATDKKIGQLVLMVKEGAREFETAPPRNLLMEAVKKDPVNWPDLLCKSLGIRRNQLRVVRHGKKSVGAAILNKTRGETRHFLCGLDERQLFIAQLTRAATSVREAHESLKRTEITLAEGKVSKVVRQGEWFFLPATADELDRIQTGLKKNLIFFQKKTPIGAGRNPHVADERLSLPGLPSAPGARWAVRAAEVFVRGKIRHVDHATVSFATWHKVIRNNEANAGQAAPQGVGWID
jgi:hypothetical protein